MRKLSVLVCLTVAIGCALCSSPPAAAEQGPALRLAAGTFDPLHEQLPLPEHLRLKEEPGAGYFAIQFKEPITQRLLDSMRSKGARTLQYLPDHAYLLYLPAATKRLLRNMPEVRWLGPVQPGWKISTELGSSADGPIYVSIDLFPGEEPEAAADEIAATGAEVIQTFSFSDTRRLKVRATLDQIEQIANLPASSWIEEVGEISLRNNSQRWVIQTNVIDSTSIWDHDLHGEDQIIGLIDESLDMESCFFRDPLGNTPGPGHRKVVAYRSSAGLGASIHGTHTAGSLAGDQFPINGTVDGNGNAYAAKISHSWLGDITGSGTQTSNLYDYLLDAHTDGARVHSNSWGDDNSTAYTTWSRDSDLFSHDFEDSLLIFAVTNGPELRSPENAKNVLAVGASNNGTSADAFCVGGIGPTADGRRKPEIFAPGCNITSAQAAQTCSTITRSGTSYAAPAVTAAAALVRQYFEEGWYPSGVQEAADSLSPSAALTKAILLNSAVDMTGISDYPSNQEGWGRLLLENALYFDGDSRDLAVLADIRNAAGQTTGESDSFLIEVTGSSEELRCTLVFTEPPAALMASSATVNDLNLKLVSPSGLIYRGNVFNTGSGYSVSGGAADPLNNVEMVRIPSPETGEWLLTVMGSAVNSGSQGFALVATGEMVPATAGSLRYAAHRINDSGSLGNSDGLADPGETFLLPLTLLNLHPAQASEVSARLATEQQEILQLTRHEAAFPNIDPDSTGRSLLPHYRLTLSPDAACGENILMEAEASHSGGSSSSLFTIQVGSKELEQAAEDLPLSIPIYGTVPVTSTIEVNETLTVIDVDVSVSISHYEDVGELTVELTSPENTTVVLHDQSLTGTASLDTSYDSLRQPDGPGLMSDFIGEPAQGSWTLSILDSVSQLPAAPGTLNSWSLLLRASAGGLCEPLDCAGDPIPSEVPIPSFWVLKENILDMRFQWDEVAAASGYRIWRSSSPDLTRAEMVDSTTATTLLETGGAVEEPENWFYRVRAVNSCEWEGP